MKRVFLVFAIFLAVIAASLAALLFIEFDSPAIGNAFLKEASRATGLQLAAQEFRFNVLRGLFLENVEASGFLSGTKMVANIPKLQLQHQLMPLLRGKLAVIHVRVEEPVIELIEDISVPVDQSRRPEKRPGENPPKADGVQQEAETDGLDLEISEFILKDAALNFRAAEKKKPVSVAGLNIELKDLSLRSGPQSVTERFSGNGTVNAEQILLDGSEINQISGNVRMSAGKLQTDDLEFKAKQGKFNAKLKMDLSSSPVSYNLTLQGDPLDTNTVLGDNTQGGYGPSKLEFRATGNGTRRENVLGHGTLTISEGHLPESSVLLTIERLIGKTTLVGAPYKPSTAVFRVEEDEILLEKFRLEIEAAAVDVAGSIAFEGPLALQVRVRVPRQNVKIKEVPNEMLDVLTDDSGWVVLPFLVRGMPEHPQTTLDMGAIMQQTGEGSKKVIKKKLKDKILDFFRRKD